MVNTLMISAEAGTLTGYAMPSSKSGSKNWEQNTHTFTKLYMEIVLSSLRTSAETNFSSQLVLYKENHRINYGYTFIISSSILTLI